MADAELLDAHSSRPNADHLAGLAAECGFKALIAAFLDGSIDESGVVVHPDTGKKIKLHIDKLWSEMAIIARSRSAGALTPLLISEPFADWRVDERYFAGSHLTPETVAGHISAARTVVGILEQAHLDGALT